MTHPAERLPLTRCKGPTCGAMVRFGRSSKSGTPQPFDPEPHEQGNLRLDPDNTLIVDPLAGTLLAGSEPRYMPHHATCPDAAMFHGKHTSRDLDDPGDLALDHGQPDAVRSRIRDAVKVAADIMNGTAEPSPPPRSSPIPIAPHVATSATSRAAAVAIAEQLTRLQQRVLDTIRSHGPITDEAGAAMVSMSGNTWRPRRVELAAAFLIEQAGTALVSSGRRAAAWRAVEQAP